MKIYDGNIRISEHNPIPKNIEILNGNLTLNDNFINDFDNFNKLKIINGDLFVCFKYDNKNTVNVSLPNLEELNGKLTSYHSITLPKLLKIKKGILLTGYVFVELNNLVEIKGKITIMCASTLVINNLRISETIHLHFGGKLFAELLNTIEGYLVIKNSSITAPSLQNITEKFKIDNVMNLYCPLIIKNFNEKYFKPCTQMCTVKII